MACCANICVNIVNAINRPSLYPFNNIKMIDTYVIARISVFITFKIFMSWKRTSIDDLKCLRQKVKIALPVLSLPRRPNSPDTVAAYYPTPYSGKGNKKIQKAENFNITWRLDLLIKQAKETMH